MDFFIVEYWYPASRSGGEKNYTVAKVFDCHAREERYIDFGPDSLGETLKWANTHCNSAYVESRVQITQQKHAKFCRLAAKGEIDNEP